MGQRHGPGINPVVLFLAECFGRGDLEGQGLNGDLDRGNRDFIFFREILDALHLREVGGLG